MIIGIDGNEANVEKKVGVSVYTANLLYEFREKASSDLRFKIYLRTPPVFDLPKPSEWFTYEVVHGPFAWSQLFLPLSLYTNGGLSTFFSPAHYTPRFCPVPLVVTIHDLAYEYFPQEFLAKDLYKLKNWTLHAVNQAKKIIAVSINTKKDLIKFYNLPEDKIEVVYNGYEKQIKYQKSNIKNKKILKNWKLEIGNYILFVGTLQPRKNVKLLIDSFPQIKKIYPHMKLVICGKKGWLYDEILTSIDQIEEKNDIVLTGYVSNEELAALYSHAFCLTMPSLYEGFGIPILEAFNFGCPVVSSFTSSLPEIGSDACLYFDPHDKNNLVDKIVELRQNPTLKKQLADKGKRRLEEFSWQKCAKESLAVITSVV